MVVTPTGYLTTPLRDCSLSHADSAAFRTWAGAADQAAALAKIYFNRAAFGYTSPVLVLSFEEGYRADEDDENGYETTGRIEAIFQDAVVLTDEKEAFYDFGNKISDVTKEVFEKARTAGYLHITGIDFGLGPQRPDKDKQKTINVGDFFQWILYYETNGMVG